MRKGGLLRTTILDLVETGGSSDVKGVLNALPAHYIAAFRGGLEVSLVVATVLMLLAGTVATFVRDSRRPADVSSAAAG